MKTTFQAWCRCCEAKTEHRFCREPIQEICCNDCHTIAITFHERMVVHPFVEPPLEEYEKVVITDVSPAELADYHERAAAFIGRHKGVTVQVCDTQTSGEEVEVNGANADGIHSEAVWLKAKHLKRAT